MSCLAYLDILNAVNRVNGWREGFEMGHLERQLSQTLEVYKRRDEFNGTIDSALECLKLAEYEVDHLIETKETENE